MKINNAHLLKQAAQFETAGKLVEAEAIYRQLVDAAPDFALAWHALGLLAYNAGKLALAVQLVTKAVMADASNALYQRNLGEMCRRLGLLDQSILCGIAATKLSPKDIDAHYNLGLAYSAAKDFDKAMRSFRIALKLKPDHGLSWNNLGSALEHQGDQNKALKAYARAIAINPRHVEAQNNLGVIYRGRGRLDEARACFQAAIDTQPDFAEAHDNLSSLDDVAAMRPVAACLSVTKAGADQAHMQGISLYRQNRFEEALACYDDALSLRPNFPAALNSKGFVLQDMGCMREALICFEKAVELAPEFAMVRLNLGMAQLKLGDWKNGWDNYEARWTGSTEASDGSFQRPSCPLPHWDGEGETKQQGLLVNTEQGFGDTFQFARYLSMASERFGKVGFVCSQPTMRLMEWALGNQIVLLNRMPADFSTWHCQCALMSLPRAFKTRPEQIPADVPYLKVPTPAKAHWQDRLEAEASGRLRIGVAWAGRKVHQYDARRSLLFNQLLPLLRDKRVSWVSLQKWVPEDQRPAIPAEVDWLDWTEELTDFADTAALMSNLDLVISVDSSMVHLAGALNVPVWMMNRFDTEWRWFCQRDDSPWYPSLRIFNQPTFGDWTSVLSEVQAKLTSLQAPRKIKTRKSRSGAVTTLTKATPTSSAPMSVAQTMQVASQLQSAGRLQESEKILRQILQLEPNHAHAMHLLGVVAHQAGQPVLAIELISNAVALETSDALFHSNLAEMCRQQGQLEKAIKHGYRAVEIDPSMASAQSNLGIALYDAKDYDAAEVCHQKALELSPIILQSLNNMGSILRARKDLPGAANWYRRALAVNPNYLDALSNLGAALVEVGKADDAVPYLELALSIVPNYPEALCNLGLARLKQEQIEQAVVLLERSLQIKKDYPEALIGLARARYEQVQLPEAEALLRRVLADAPNNTDAWCQLAAICIEQGYSTEAESCYQKALVINPSFADGLAGLGNLKLEQGKIDEAVKLFEEAIAIAPDNLGARFHLTQAKKVKFEDENFASLEALVPGLDSMADEKKISLHYALGKSYDDLKQYDKGFPHYMEGARIKRQKLHYDAQVDAARTQYIIDVFDRNYFASLHGAGDSSDVPVFVLGMPRSGTTLTEQIIASHPLVHGSGELRDLMEVVQQPIIGTEFRPFPESLNGLNRAILTRWGQDYVARLRNRAPAAKRITDKMPANYAAMGLIPLLIPNAKIIHVKRSPVDTCVSCFTRLFNRHQDATYDLAELGQHYVNYARLMAHWRKVLPKDAFIEVQYEDIVADMEGQARRLIEYCDLEWDDACLAFHKNTRSIRTASVTQVRQPIYNSSVERWRNYEKFLEPLLDVLSTLPK